MLTEDAGYKPFFWLNDPKFDQVRCQQSRQPDIAYVVDIVEAIDGQVFVNEINAASTSGVYWAPITDLLFALRLVAYDEFAGELML
jgi:hypothetical protein